MKKIVAIACAVLAVDLKHSARNLGVDIEFKFLEAGLHNNPKKLKEKLQAAIDKLSATDDCSRIIVGYGICGKGTIGVQSRNVPLIIPRVHDCIALFLGGDSEYKHQFKKYPGTYYLSAGWCEEKTEPMSQKDQWAYYGDKKLHFNDLVEQHGEQSARQTFDFLNSWQKNYQRAAFIETGAKTSPRYEQYAREMARKYKWKYDKIQGNQALIEKLITADQSSADILFVPPENVIGFDAIQSKLSANPIWGSEKMPDLSEPAPPDSPADTDKKPKIKTGLGIDAGGTYTDAVIYDLKKNQTLDKSKSLTTKWDFTQGIELALKQLDKNKLRHVEMVSLSTTLATNAIVENEGQKVGLILMPPYGLDVEKSIPHSPKTIIQGQLEITGREILAVNPEQIRQQVGQMIENHKVSAFAVSGYAGSINPAHELQVKEIITQETGLFVTCGHELSDSLNFQTRATTAMLNARIIPRLNGLLQDLERVMDKMNIQAPVVVVKGDGSLMSANMARQRPVETILSGPAASVAGAQHLTGITDALVVDMGGTTTDTAALINDAVDLNEKGSNVGGHRTHVKALEIRTAGLGGDSLIQFENGEFLIGPKRVAPMAWLGYTYPNAAEAINFLNRHQRHYASSTRKMQILARTGASAPLKLTAQESQVISLLDQRPHSIDELIQKTNALSESGLSLSRLEEAFMIQKCGLTMTDLLHITGQFTQWDTDMATAYCMIFSDLTKKEISQLTEEVLGMGVNRLTVELLKRQLDNEINPDSMQTCPVCRFLLDRLMADSQPGYEISMKLKHPVIGIGAPVKYFLSKAVKPLGTEPVLPKDADVANAIGAITSKVVIKKQLRIIPGEMGNFIVEGIAGTRQFKTFQDADIFAREKLMQMVRELGLKAGTRSQQVDLTIEDQVPTTASGDPIFMGRTIHACLTGQPDHLSVE